ncbi:MAG TPA: hypothetical protein VIX83_03155 [Candidatus Cybelea sp.]
MKTFAAVLLLVTLGVTGAGGSVTVNPSSIGFKDAIAACPSGTLAALTLTLGHLRIAEASGVDSDIDDANPSAQSLMLSKGSQSATVKVNAAKNSVTAKHVTLKSSGRVACIAPD